MAKTFPYQFVIGLEVHVELGTETKMFCRCINEPFGGEPNSHICPICVGLPGTLPVPNKEAVRRTIVIGKALGGEIAQFSKWDRKHYFYPDSPKGYQISQYDLPLVSGGRLELLDDKGEVESVINFERIHLEEDAGKLLHGAVQGQSQVDLNRAGVPLAEMVTKPDLTSPEQARRFLQELRLLVRAVGISDADMEKGQLRCDVNISLKFRHEDEEVWTPITEIKNVNSTRSVERSLIVEAERLYSEWCANGPIRQRKNKLTAGWDEETGKITIHRAKEEANDYRYFPEPDIPPVAVYEVPELNPENITLPELPNEQRLRYVRLGITASDAELLVNNPERATFADTMIGAGLPAKAVTNWLINAPESAALSEVHFRELLQLAEVGEVGFAAAKQNMPVIVQKLQAEPTLTVVHVTEELGIRQSLDESVIQLAVDTVLQQQATAVQQLRDGNEKVLGFLVGQVMKQTGGKAAPQKIQQIIKQRI